jgi:hypothetical protein
MITDFCGYGNENYEDTVRKALPGFFLYYDARFAPQETVITMDYPTLGFDEQLEGIDAISQYVNDICLEQQFMGKFPEEYVVNALESYQKTYRRQFYNLCEIL